ncbi:MAG: exodeoxyribonuclease VII large subunit [Anaerolineales bacterium]
MIIPIHLTALLASSMLRAVDTLSLFGSARVWSVGDLTVYIRQLIESDYRLQEIWVSGEVSNLSRPSSGHLYFTLKDEHASLRCVMWRSQVEFQEHLPRDGEQLEVFGHIGVYEAGGQYQLYAETLRPAGEGERFKEFLELKEKLEKEGLFATERKRPLPPWPRTLGVVTSPTGAALRDVIHVLERRYPLVQLLLAPATVQGERAPGEIVAGLSNLNEHGACDVILLVRGGGSLEDLWAFNDEQLVRAVARSDAPVVTGIGHETDIILADFAADVRAPTPSAAAEVSTPDRASLGDDLHGEQVELSNAFRDQIIEKRASLQALQTRLASASPRARIENARQRMDEFWRRMQLALKHELVVQRQRVSGLDHTLRAVSPGEILTRGYAIVTKKEQGIVVRSIEQVDDGDRIHVQVHDGDFDAEVRAE